MRPQHFTLLSALVVLILACTPAHANLSDYRFSAGYGKPMTPGATTRLLKAGSDDVTSAVTNIGFTFAFDGTPYTQFSVSSDGLIGLGSRAVSPCWLNKLTTTTGICDGVSGYDYTLVNVPHIAPLWDDLRVPDIGNDKFDGDVNYGLTGTAPNRVLVINFVNIETDYLNFYYSTFQVRLYESSNKIEFYYENLNPNYFVGNGASIGLATTATNYLSVFPSGKGGPTASSSSVNDFFYPSDGTIPAGYMYSFTPCQITYTGDPAQGGTIDMNDGDTLLAGMKTMVYNTAPYTPFSMSMDAACSSRVVTATISGPSAAEYSFSPSPASIVSGNKPLAGTVTFKPTGVGIRRAQLRLTDDRGGLRVYNLAAEATPRITYTGIIPQGGTAAMANGDVLMSAVHVRRNQSMGFTPFTLTNIGNNESAPAAAVTYQIKGMAGGQYSIAPPNASIGSSTSHTPTITFSPGSTIGPVLDSLFVTADGETRRFALYAISDGVGARMSIENQVLADSSQLFTNRFSCAGTDPITLPMVVTNVGSLPFQITRVDYFQTDTIYRQGSPRYPLMRGNESAPVRVYDYIVTETPPVLPINTSAPQAPITVDVGATRTLYFTFIGQVPGKRFARAFVYTNAENFIATDVNGEMSQGLVTFDLYGRGTGAMLSDRPGGGRPQALQFGEVRVGESVTQRLYMVNNGTCPLRINLTRMAIVAGDVDEFELVTRPTTNVDAATGDVVLAPGDIDSADIRFTASHNGSRRAALRLVTNDSAIIVPGITERGTWYVDLYGQGRADLYAEGANLGQALIGGAPAEHRRGVVRFRNTRAVPITVASLTITGTDAAEFVADATAPWPTLPKDLLPGDVMELAVEFAPASGGPVGTRSAEVHLAASGGEAIDAPMTGLAGTREIAANPGSVSFSVTTGGQARKTVAIGNTGTMPLTITKVETSAPDFTLGALDRTQLAPGQVEYLEITFTPQGPGVVSGTLTIESNATNAPQQVTLNGVASTRRRSDDPSSATQARPGFEGVRLEAVEEFSTSGVAGVRAAGGLTLMQSIPNPGREMVEIGYRTPQRGMVQLALFDAAGREVRTLESGVRDAGERTVRVNVSGLPAGIYVYRLTTADGTLTRTLTIVR